MTKLDDFLFPQKPTRVLVIDTTPPPKPGAPQPPPLDNRQALKGKQVVRIASEKPRRR